MFIKSNIGVHFLFMKAKISEFACFKGKGLFLLFHSGKSICLASSHLTPFIFFLVGSKYHLVSPKAHGLEITLRNCNNRTQGRLPRGRVDTGITCKLKDKDAKLN